MTSRSQVVRNVTLSTLGAQKDNQKPRITDDIILLWYEKTSMTEKAETDTSNSKRAVEKAVHRAHHTFVKDSLSSVKRLSRNVTHTSCTDE